jgi:hypothetical protein
MDTNTAKVVYCGEVSLDERKQAVRDVLDCGVAAPFNILVDVRALEMNLSVAQQKEFGRFLAATSELVGAKVAVLHPACYNPNLIIDVIAFSEGYTLAEFAQQSEAESWLSS